MSSTVHRTESRGAFVAILLAVALVLGLLAPRAAVNVDELLHYPHAKSVVNWYFTGGKDRASLETPVTNLKYYGQSVDNLTALVNRVFHVQDEYLTRHFTGAFMFLLLLMVSGLVARELTGSYLASVITVVALLFMPRLTGQAFGNLKDIPFALGYMTGIYAIIRYLKQMPHPHWSSALIVGLSIAFTVSVRAGGFILFGYLGLFLIAYFIWKPFELKQIVSTKPVLVRLLGQGAVILVTGYFAGLLFWPFALQDILVHPYKSLQVMQHYVVSIRQVFDGNFTWSTNLPWYYLPEWLFISTPIYIILGLLVYVIMLVRITTKKVMVQESPFYQGLFAFIWLFPLVYVPAIDSNLYSGVRQMLFTLPLMGVMSACGIFFLIRESLNSAVKYPVVVLFFLLMLLPFKHQASTFPADYIYFNELAGGNKKAWSNYEYDYYFHGLKQPFDYLAGITEANDKLVVATNSNLVNYYHAENGFQYEYARYLERSSGEWDYAVFGVNYLNPWLLKNNKWQSSQVLKTFYHQGNPVAVILKRTSKNDLHGLRELESGNFEAGEHLLLEALKVDPNNVWLYVQLARHSLKVNDQQRFQHYISKAEELHPEYEPVYLLETQRLYNEKKYEEALDKMTELLEINPRYVPASDLLKKIKDKININSN